MKNGGKTFKNALEDVLVTDEEFFKLEDLELLSVLKKGKAANSSKAKEAANV